MKLKILVLFGCSLLQSIIAQVALAPTINYSNKTLYKAIETLSPTLYSHIHNSTDADKLIELLDQTQHNITFFLPNITSIATATAAQELFYNSLTFLMLNGSYSKKSLLSDGRKFYTTLQPASEPIPKISIGPLLVNSVLSTDKIELFSGLSKAQISGTEISCRNGVIHHIDQFLYPAEPPLVTISIIDETEYMESLLKSLNVSDVISGKNTTVLAPISDAWTRAQGSSLPFGTLVHTLKYLVLDGLYTTDELIHSMNKSNGSIAIQSNYKRTKLEFTLNTEKKILVNKKAIIVRSDILTTTGIIHLIDDVFSPGEPLDDMNSNSNNSTKATIYPFNSTDRKSSSSSINVTAFIFYHCSFVLCLCLLLL